MLTRKFFVTRITNFTTGEIWEYATLARSQAEADYRFFDHLCRLERFTENARLKVESRGELRH